MTISFIVIAYNEARNIAATLAAIAAQIALPEHEIIVVNDGSRDATLAIVQEAAQSNPNIRIVDLQPNRGRGAARAAGVAAAHSDYLAFVDADIALPSDWLQQCMPYMQDYDACGGTAVPDGDVAWIHRVFGLQPKVAAHSTTVTGSNGLFRRHVFDQVAFDPDKRDGEDVALGHAIACTQLRAVTVPGLLVDHHETKTFGESVNWLFISGIGASRQLYEYRQLRLPDLAFFGFLGVLVSALVLSVVGIAAWMALAVPVYILASSFMHIRGKFVLMAQPVRSLVAVAANGGLLLAYYIGRAVGMVTHWRRLWLIRSPA